LAERPERCLIGIDSRLISHGRPRLIHPLTCRQLTPTPPITDIATQLTQSLARNGSRLKFPRLNLIDVIWKQRPAKPSGQIYIHEERFAGRSAKEKIESIQTWIKAQKPLHTYAVNKNPAVKTSSMANVPTATIISNLSSVAWLLNLRGSDLPYTPVFHSYLFVSLAAAVLFVDRKKISSEVETYLKQMNVVLRDYGDIFTFLRQGGWGAGRVRHRLVTDLIFYLTLLFLGPHRCQNTLCHLSHAQLPEIHPCLLVW